MIVVYNLITCFCSRIRGEDHKTSEGASVTSSSHAHDRMINRYWKGFFILVAENGVHLGSLESISRDIYLTSLPVLHKLLTFLRSILQVTKGILKRARVIMALQADQVQIKTIAHLYAITKREHNLARQCDNDVTPIFKSSWRWTGVEFCR